MTKPMSDDSDLAFDKERLLQDYAKLLALIGAVNLDGAYQEIRRLRAEVERLKAENERLKARITGYDIGVQILKDTITAHKEAMRRWQTKLDDEWEIQTGCYADETICGIRDEINVALEEKK